jgi:hypothetical protein|tara:strand:- start:80 stop:481 length:402 start_codon:yes stop_codon:yes gene_type:complete
MDKIAEAYISEEFPLNLFESWDVVLELFKNIEETTDEDSKEMYDKLPSEVKVYRGVLTDDRLKYNLGVSWTTDKKVAEMFALRFAKLGGTPYLMEGEVNKEDILYFTNAREESEVLIDSEDLIWVEVDEINGN